MLLIQLPIILLIIKIKTSQDSITYGTATTPIILLRSYKKNHLILIFEAKKC